MELRLGSGNTVNVTTDKFQFAFTIDSVTATECGFHGNFMELDGNEITGDIRFHMTKMGGGDTPDAGDIGLSAIDPVNSTETSLTVNATITGNINQYLPRFPNFACGFIWSAEGTPTMNGNSITGTPDAWGKFEVTITDLEPGTEYTIIAWLKLTPESEPILSNSIVMSTLGGSTPSGDWVDLGLPSGLLWASCNVGATSPEDYGDYFAWGEIQTKSTYSWDNYRYGHNSHELTKYCDDPEYGADGYTDNLTTLQPGDDAAIANVGNGARTPTKTEWEEMVNNTTREWTTHNGVDGWKFTAPNGNSIFLPGAGEMSSTGALLDAGPCGHYWASTLGIDGPDHAYQLGFTTSGFGGDLQTMTRITRRTGISVRAVKSAN